MVFFPSCWFTWLRVQVLSVNNTWVKHQSFKIVLKYSSKSKYFPPLETIQCEKRTTLKNPHVQQCLKTTCVQYDPHVEFMLLFYKGFQVLIDRKHFSVLIDRKISLSNHAAKLITKSSQERKPFCEPLLSLLDEMLSHSQHTLLLR